MTEHHLRAAAARLRATVQWLEDAANALSGDLPHTARPEPDFTSPIAGRIEVRQPCPYCGDQQMIPRSQYAEHIARLHPDVREAVTIDQPSVDSHDASVDSTDTPECSASRSGHCLREAQSETACDTEAGECVHGGQPSPDGRRAQYADALRECAWRHGPGATPEQRATAVMAVADREMQQLRLQLGLQQSAAGVAADNLKQKADKAEAANARVRAASETEPPLENLMGDEPTDYARGWAAAMARVEAALDQAEPEANPPGSTEATVRAAVCHPDGGHLYLSTGCLHHDHAYCNNMTGLNGAKRPGECKHCAAPCVCDCHTDTTQEP